MALYGPLQGLIGCIYIQGNLFNNFQVFSDFTLYGVGRL